MNNESLDTQASLCRELPQHSKTIKVIRPTLAELQNLYPGINLDFDYGLLISILEYLEEISGVFIYPKQGQVSIISKDGSSYSLGEILFEAENIYSKRLNS
tara:strand:+ start:201 stop:503 length:303 start_codon:yes stop_codon:yes gene_type:complete